MDDSKLLHESNLTAQQPQRTPITLWAFNVASTCAYHLEQNL